MEKPTSVIAVAEFVFRGRERWCRHSGLEVMQTEVGDFEDPATVDQTVGRLEVPVRHHLAVVQINHTLQTTTKQSYTSDFAFVVQFKYK